MPINRALAPNFLIILNKSMMQMNRFSLLFFGLFLSFSALQAQYASVFGQDSTQWIFEWSNLPGTQQDTLYSRYDSSFAGRQWTKIEIPNNFSYDGGWLSEDSSTGQLWYRPIASPQYPNDTASRLIMDLSLQVGDTFDISPAWGALPDSLQIVDSIYTELGRKHIRFKADATGVENFTFIEGVGPNLGILYKQSGVMMFQYLLCAYQDAQQSYLNKTHGYCNVYSGGPHGLANLAQQQFALYPNPVKEQLQIEQEASLSVDRLQLYNALGQLVWQKEFSPQLSLEGLPAGHYILQFWQGGKLLESQKLIKQ